MLKHRGMRKLLTTAAAQMAISTLWLGSLSPDPGPMPEMGLVDAECRQAMAARAPDRVWTEADWRSGDVVPSNFLEIPAHEGKRVRIAGVLHVEFEFAGLFQSWAKGDHQPENAVAVALRLLPDGHWRDPTLTDRCVVLEGVVDYRPMFGVGPKIASLDPVGRLEMWSQPVHPLTVFDPIVVPPPPPAGYRPR